jgi:hypothetical protein
VPEESQAGEPDTVKTVAYLRGRMRTMALPRELTYSEASAFAEYG